MAWLYFIGHCLLGYTDKEVGQMNITWLLKMYRFYKNDYDFRLSQKTYHEIDEAFDHENECLPW